MKMETKNMLTDRATLAKLAGLETRMEAAERVAARFSDRGKTQDAFAMYDYIASLNRDHAEICNRGMR